MKGFEEYWEQRAKYWVWNVVNAKSNAQSVWNDAAGESRSRVAELEKEKYDAQNEADETRIMLSVARQQVETLRAAAEAYLIEATPNTLRALNEALSAKE